MFLLRKPYLVFLGDATETMQAKTGQGLWDWCPDDVLGEFALAAATVSTGAPSLSIAEAADRGAGSLVIGVAPFGGGLPPAWHPTLFAAVDNGLDIVSGMHARLESVPGLAAHAAGSGVKLHNVRHSDRTFTVASGRKRSGMRLLTVGTDCALGKKYTALALIRALHQHGIAATFRATGQTGIMIAGAGVAIDAVVADFVAGAAESLSPDNDADHWDIIEGQGSLYHPAYAGVSLGLLHGSQPDAIVLCHDPARQTIDSYPDYPMPTIEEAIELHLQHARRTNPRARCVGVSLNTSRLPADGRRALIDAYARALALPVFDPLIDPLDDVVGALAPAFAA